MKNFIYPASGHPFIGMPKNTKSKGTNLPVEISPIKRQRPAEVVNTPFYQDPIMRQSSFRINGPVLNFDLRPGQAFSKAAQSLDR